MCLSEEQLIKHCEKIRNSYKIKNNIIVLCEGEIKDVKKYKNMYKNMEKMPDANFYNACVPTWWTVPKPAFFNCGGWSDVVKTYFKLLELHENEKLAENQDPEDSSNFDDPNKLFAIIDLDLQNKKIDGYDFTDSEEVFKDLYQGIHFNQENGSKHSIFVTGLIHKEAYFFLPELQHIFENPPISKQNLVECLTYQNKSISLENIYLDMCDGLGQSRDLEQNFSKAAARVNYCANLDCRAVDQLQSSWRKEFVNCQEEEEKEKLIFALLRLAKAKDYWKEIKPGTEEEFTEEESRIYREDLVLEIGRFYAQQTDSKYHLPSLFTSIYERSYGKDNV